MQKKTSALLMRLSLNPPTYPAVLRSLKTCSFVFWVGKLLTFIFIMYFSTKVWADGVRIIIDDREAVSAGAHPELVDGRLFVPLRFVSEQLGGEVIWNGTEKSVTVISDWSSVYHVVGTSFGVDTSGAVIDVDVPSYIKDGSTMVSIRMIAEAFWADVAWEPVTKTIFIDSYSGNVQADSYFAPLAEDIAYMFEQSTSGHEARHNEDLYIGEDTGEEIGEDTGEDTGEEIVEDTGEELTGYEAVYVDTYLVQGRRCHEYTMYNRETGDVFTLLYYDELGEYEILGEAEQHMRQQRDSLQ